jgi:hypothetical protein
MSAEVMEGRWSLPHLALGELGLDRGPCLTLSSIAEQVHDNSALGDSFIDLEQVLAWNPAILLSFFPRCAVLADTNDHVQAIVSQVETLAMTLGAIADEGKSIVLEVFLLPVRCGKSLLLGAGGIPRASRGASPLALLRQVSRRV